MKKETKSFAEYKAPRCKCVKVHVQNLVCASPNEFTQGGGGYYDETNTNENGEY